MGRDRLETGIQLSADLNYRAYNKTKLTNTPMTLLTETTDQNFLLEYVKDYCNAITQNYLNYHKRCLERNLDQERGDIEKSFAQQQLDEIANGTANLMKFRFEVGRKYYKIIQQEFDTFRDRNEWRDGSVHSFVGKEKSVLGNVYKPASWRAPHTKYVRFSFCEPTDLRKLLDPNFVDWAGGYLYLR